MQILHIAPHFGGGVGTVMNGWLGNDKENVHTLISLDPMKEHKVRAAENPPRYQIEDAISRADVTLIHTWDNHWLLAGLLSEQLPACRLAFWSHNNVEVPTDWYNFPDRFINTSPIQGPGEFIWSTGDISRFLKIKRRKKDRTCILVYSRKTDPDFIKFCDSYLAHFPDMLIIVLGEYGGYHPHNERYIFRGKVRDVAPYFARASIFIHQLRPDHYGTCEQVLGEAMAAGLKPLFYNNAAEGYIVGGTNLFSTAALRKRARKLYDINAMVDRWSRVFEEMMTVPKRERGPLCS